MKLDQIAMKIDEKAVEQVAGPRAGRGPRAGQRPRSRRGTRAGTHANGREHEQFAVVLQGPQRGQ